MPQQRITGIMDGKPTPIGPAPPPFSSAGTRWSGFLIEGHNVEASREEVGWSWHSTHVGIVTAGPSLIQMSGAAGNLSYVADAGGVTIIPAGTDHTTIRHSGGGLQFLLAELDAPRLNRLLHGEGPQHKCTLTPRININDPQVATLLHSMRAEIEAGCPAGALYDESLSLALAAYVYGRYSTQARTADAVEPRFSEAQTRRVLDYMHAHLGSDFSLIDLATVLQLSPRHFSRLFKNTFGVTPYKYIVSERVNQARRLLASRRISIVEIAQSLGFANQSHFTDVFRKSIGVTPRRYQQEG
jgi:AraC family transcriptional regulator